MCVYEGKEYLMSVVPFLSPIHPHNYHIYNTDAMQCHIILMYIFIKWNWRKLKLKWIDGGEQGGEAINAKNTTNL
jgi:hypothetical protein